MPPGFGNDHVCHQHTRAALGVWPNRQTFWIERLVWRAGFIGQWNREGHTFYTARAGFTNPLCVLVTQTQRAALVLCPENRAHAAAGPGGKACTQKGTWEQRRSVCAVRWLAMALSHSNSGSELPSTAAATTTQPAAPSSQHSSRTTSPSTITAAPDHMNGKLQELADKQSKLEDQIWLSVAGGENLLKQMEKLIERVGGDGAASGAVPDEEGGGRCLLALRIDLAGEQQTQHPKAWRDAILVYDQLVHDVCEVHHGAFVSRADSGENLIIFQSSLSAVRAAVLLQEKCVKAAWPMDMPEEMLRMKVADAVICT